MKKTILFLLVSVLILAVDGQVLATDGQNRVEYRATQVKAIINQLAYIPAAYKTNIIEKIVDYRETYGKKTWGEEIDTLSNLNVYIANYYNRLAAYIQKNYELLNTAIAFINQHNVNHVDYVAGAGYFKTTVYTNEVAPILTSLNALKNSSLSDCQQMIEQDLLNIGGLDIEDIDAYNVNKTYLNNRINQNLPTIKENFNTAYQQISQDINSVLSIAADPNKVASN